MATGKGLYLPDYEHDACGVGMVVNIRGNKSHQLVDNALCLLEHMQHRGAEGADGCTGDGAGILLQIPHEFILLQGIPVPERGRYGTGMVFLPKDPELQQQALAVIIEETERQGLQLQHIRKVPVAPDCLGRAALDTQPDIRQIFISGVADKDVEGLERTLYLIRRRIEDRLPREQYKDFYVCSLSSRLIVYKGMLTSKQLRQYFPDLTSPYFTSALAMVHSRFSTNTFPTWALAQPFRLLAHNGEINTIRGNRAWMQARQAVLPHTVKAPIVQADMSDSASFDNVLEYLVMAGLSLPHALSVMVPESFNDKNPISPQLKAFYEYHSILMEPWDGPAALLFSDGRFAGGMLDRNGLRPSRYVITNDDTIVVASEVGALPIDPATVKEKGRLQPGKILLVDTQEHRIYYDGEIKQQLANAHPYGQWLQTNRIELENLRSGRRVANTVDHFPRSLAMFGFTREDVETTIMPMCVSGSEPTAAMGNDTPLAVLSPRPQLLFNYFRQQFAQVTNPAIDSIRESLVMSLTEYIGRVGTGILSPSESNCKMVRLPHPILTNTALDLLCNIRYKGFNAVKLPIVFEWARGEDGLRQALDRLCRRAAECVNEGCNYIILSDRETSPEMAAIPSLLAVSAVHHYLIKAGLRVQTALIVESGEVREPMHAALLLGYGASALCPYMAFAVLDHLVKDHKVQADYPTAEANYIKAMKKALLKIMAKMGISTIRSYRGAKLFEAIGLSQSLLADYFGTPSSTIGGIGLETIARDATRFHHEAYPDNETQSQAATLSPLTSLPLVGQFSYRRDGISHAWFPQAIATLQQSVRKGDFEQYLKFSKMVRNAQEPIFLRDLLDFKPSENGPIPIEEVESEEEIVKHFTTGAMSFGALSKEAHETICLAMNRLGTRSNTGEGGEDAARFHEEVDGVSLCSKVKQVASGRFGVTTEYLVNAEEIQIKVAQGAKPGEGGQLPGFKVDEVIARTRHSIPGISLISPPPHHDVYSIEDLAQLIFDLRSVNPRAAISVKLVAESGVGTIAAGVAKAKADLIVISGAEGGTGASPASSMRFAGISPEIGIAEAQQTLSRNSLRSHVRLQADGQLKTGHDVVMMALLGADEFAFGTSVLISLGCVMLRKCNRNTCPLGVTTQDPELRKHFLGRADHLVNYFTFMAREVRQILAAMGFRKLRDIVGRTDLILQPSRSLSSSLGADIARKVSRLDFSRLLVMEKSEISENSENSEKSDNSENSQPSELLKYTLAKNFTIANTDRAVGARLSGEIALQYGSAGLPDDKALDICFKGSAGQSFAAFLVGGVTFRLQGETNDYFAKGLSGGRVAIMPPAGSQFAPEENIIAGNTGLYGATSGQLFVNGRVGERFAVRNSGAIAVVEGAGDHCCEYMTGGRVVVLGPTGRNFAAGMSGGMAYVYDPEGKFDYFCNMEMVEINLVEESVYRKELHSLIEQHHAMTGSPLARRMLDHWDHYVGQFVSVVPIEYKQVLQQEQLQRLQEKIASVSRDY